MKKAPAIMSSADIATDATIGANTQIWHNAQVREGAHIGKDCVIGRGAYVGAEVKIGDHCKVQNYALIYEPAKIDRGVFIGPAAVLTNDQYPRAVNPDLSPKSSQDWTPVGVCVEEGASIGAKAVCVAPVKIGRWAMVAAGSTVIKDVPPHAIVAGTPAKLVGWVGRSGKPLQTDRNGQWICPDTGELYTFDDHTTGLKLTK